MDPARRDRARGALVGAAVGDCLGAPFEGAPVVHPDEIGPLEGVAFSLTHTDDTVCTLVVARHLAEVGGVDPDRLVLELAEAWAAEPWRGWGPGPPRVFAAVRAGEPWRRAARAVYEGGSWGNGAAMRVAACAVAARGDLRRAAGLAAAQAEVTHAHPVAVDAARLQAVVVTLALAAGEVPGPGELAATLEPHVRTPQMRERLEALAGLPAGADAATLTMTFGHGVAAVESVPAAWACAAGSGGDPMAAVRTAIAMGGDTDTIASMAAAVVGAAVGAGAFPATVVDRIGPAAELSGLADRLTDGGA